jgi:hypothetical protein
MEFILKIKKNVCRLRARAISGDDKIHKAHVRKAHVKYGPSQNAKALAKNPFHNINCICMADRRFKENITYTRRTLDPLLEIRILFLYAYMCTAAPTNRNPFNVSSASVYSPYSFLLCLMHLWSRLMTRYASWFRGTVHPYVHTYIN